MSEDDTRRGADRLSSTWHCIPLSQSRVLIEIIYDKDSPTYECHWIKHGIVIYEHTAITSEIHKERQSKRK